MPYLALKKLLSSEFRTRDPQFYPSNIFLEMSYRDVLRRLVGSRVIAAEVLVDDGDLMITFKPRRAKKAMTIILKARPDGGFEVRPFMADGE